MSDPPRAVVFWSGGKDSAWALHTARQQGLAQPCLLLTTYSEQRRIVPLQEVPMELIEAQAAALELPLLAVPLPEPCPNAEYESTVVAALNAARADYGIIHAVCGDIFLAEIRDWRDALFQRAGIQPLYPLWGSGSRWLAWSMLAGGLEAALSCVDTHCLPPEWLGRSFDSEFLQDLAALNLRREEAGQQPVDACGETGEFQTLVYGLPGFSAPLQFELDARQPRLLQERYAAASLRLLGRPS